jgi:hypothetical protein
LLNPRVKQNLVEINNKQKTALPRSKAKTKGSGGNNSKLQI